MTAEHDEHIRRPRVGVLSTRVRELSPAAREIGVDIFGRLLDD
jgi:hypothetical protein